MGPLRRSVRELGLGLVTLGVIVLLFVAYQLFGTNITEAHNQSKLAKQFRAAVTAAKPVPQTTPTTTPTTAPTPPTTAADVLPSIPPGGAVDHLTIPSIHVDKYVVEGTDEDALRHGPGHYAGTAYPGQVGNTAIAGHRTTYGAPFFELNQVKPGDPILITDVNGHTWDYVVDKAPFVVSPGDVTVLDPTPYASLTLTTCTPRFSATSRLIVTAKLKGQAGAVVSPPTAVTTNTTKQLATDEPAAVPGATGGLNLGTGRSSAWTPSILYGLLVLGLWVVARLAINRTRRWYRAGAIVVGIGVCLVPLWFCFENVILLFPQSI